jgi:hypothetical protein
LDSSSQARDDLILGQDERLVARRRLDLGLDPVSVLVGHGEGCVAGELHRLGAHHGQRLAVGELVGLDLAVDDCS